MPYEAFDHLLINVEEPVHPVDGDCEPWSRWIASELRERQVPAKVQTVWFETDMNFGDGTKTVILAGHVVVFIEVDQQTVVADFTARQYAPDLPARWIVGLEEYRERMCAVLAAERMRVQ
jgi:hypothetical protein